MKTIFWTAWVIMVLSHRGVDAQNSIQVIIDEVKNDQGAIIVGIFSDQETFLKKPIIGKTVRAAAGQVVVLFDNVPAGEYAVSVIHDTNENGKLDSNFFGIPTEGFGFSNDAMGMFGPPSFDKARVAVSSSVVATLKMKYM
ncbi:MAG: DUF2141 domain-containing protein [Cytophagales bacterium]|nr:DUF2141 domain-containing protein [Cytophagales bacterium]